MLQINSAKLFRYEIDRINQLRGVLYSNLRLGSEGRIETQAGVLLPTSPVGPGRALVYEVDERIEKIGTEPNFLISHTVEPFLRDFSALASFGFDLIVSPDAGLVERLTGGRPSFASYRPAREFLPRQFSETTWVTPEEAATFSALVDDLIGLERKYFRGAMRAIRTYVAAVQRTYEDLALAYTLFVSAVESLAQDFDGYSTGWNDIDGNKRDALDTVLKKAPPTVAADVRDTIAAIEHPGLNRRYRAFVHRHVGPDYFREKAVGGPAAIGADELEEALKQAYTLRSRYVHKVDELPNALSEPFGQSERTWWDRRPALTFLGLARVTRHVIFEFIRTSPKVALEPYDYVREQPGVITAPLAAEMWVHFPLKKTAEAKRRFEGFLEQYETYLAGAEQAVFTDLRPMLESAVALWDRAPKRDRPALLALYAMFNYLLPPEDRSPDFDAVVAKHDAEAKPPSSETLVILTFLDKVEAWSLDTHREAFAKHWHERVKPGGLQIPRLLDTAICLALAERERRVGNIDEAKALVSQAVEGWPGNSNLLALEKGFDGERPIEWRDLLPPRGRDRVTRRAASPESA
jgi:hypothetical protein